ncbi:ATPase domain-containing protein [Thermoproteus sp. CP80]|uniref:ATPase domain-containing protein n=1 Tax=Thermoproteus sp. CP80 TaxID=1650659 RepID=UPI00268B5B67
MEAVIEQIFEEGLTLIKGPPGSGKTATAAWAASRHKNSIWFTFYESESRLIRFLSSLALEPPRHIFDMLSTGNRKEAVEVILKKIQEVKPDFVVVDGLNALTAEGERELVHNLFYHLLSSFVPVVLIREGDEVTATDYIADNVLLLSYKPSDRGMVRYLTVLKSRGRSVEPNVFRMILAKGGPRLISAPREARKIPSQRLTTGAPEIDREINGGVIAGSYAVVAGPPDGLASKLMVLTAAALAGSGRKVLYHHHKQIPTFMKFAESLGVDLSSKNLLWYYHPVEEHGDVAWWYRSAEMVNEMGVDVHFADNYEQVLAVAGLERVAEAAQIYQASLRKETTTVLVINSLTVWRSASRLLGSIPDYVFVFKRGLLTAYTPERIEPLRFRYKLVGRRVVFEKI